MPASRMINRCFLAGVFALAACSGAFKLERFKDNQSLYRAAMQEYQRKHWDNALAALEKLSLELPARDPLLPPTLWYLAKVHEAQGDHLLAAQSFTRLTESFPDDSLSDDALLAAGRNYGKMWNKPELDAQYGETAIETYQTLLSIYPNSPLRDSSQTEIDRLHSWLATKTYQNGMFYFRRKGYDSAIIYFKDVVKLYAETPQVKDAQLRLVEAYRAIKYSADAADACVALQKSWAGDREVIQVCGAPQTAAKPPTP